MIYSCECGRWLVSKDYWDQQVIYGRVPDRGTIIHEDGHFEGMMHYTLEFCPDCKTSFLTRVLDSALQPVVQSDRAGGQSPKQIQGGNDVGDTDKASGQPAEEADATDRQRR